jgi:hypothetical protein
MGLLFDFGEGSKGSGMKFSRGLQYSGYSQDFGLRDSRLNRIEQLNSLGFRCDEFTKTHNGRHILFAGCSFTWGDALPKEESWPYLLLKDLEKTEPVSGFFSVAYPGSSIAHQISLIFKYINDYGNPDVIFFMMPNLGRFFTIVEDHNQITSSIIKPNTHKECPQSFELVAHISFEMYSMLDQYCRSNSIKLVSSSWQHSEDKNIVGNTAELFDGKFETFFSYRDMGEGKWMYEYMQTDKDAKILASDNAHPGKARQAWFAHIMLNKYLN